MNKEALSCSYTHAYIQFHTYTPTTITLNKFTHLLIIRQSNTFGGGRLSCTPAPRAQCGNTTLIKDLTWGRWGSILYLMFYGLILMLGRQHNFLHATSTEEEMVDTQDKTQKSRDNGTNERDGSRERQTEQRRQKSRTSCKASTSQTWKKREQE